MRRCALALCASAAVALLLPPTTTTLPGRGAPCRASSGSSRSGDFTVALRATAQTTEEPPARDGALVSRRAFGVLSSGAAAVAGGAATFLPSPASARGRGTQPAVFLRYQPRIVAYGEYLTTALPKIIQDADWPALKEAVAADVATKKGKVGPLYNGESAMTLWAASYSETAITPKTKNMEEMVAAMRTSRETLETVALKGTGEGLKKEGGFFGFGGKTEAPPSPAELAKRANVALKEAKQAYNAYVEINNAGIPFEINPLPTI